MRCFRFMSTVGLVALAWGGYADEPPTDPAAAAPAVASAAAWTSDLPVAADGRHVWLWAEDYDAAEDAPRVAVHHADVVDTAGDADAPFDGPAWEGVARLDGRLAARGAAADGGTLWLVYESGAVKALSLRSGPIDGQWLMAQRSAVALPDTAQVRALAAGHGRLYALVRVESAEVLGRLDAGPEEQEAESDTDVSDRQRRNLVLGLPRNYGVNAPPEVAPEALPEAPPEVTEAGDDEAQAPDTPSDAEPVAATPPEAPDERLLVLERGAWRVVPLPEDWAAGRPVHLLAPDEPAGDPVLFVQQASEGGSRIELVRREATAVESGWSTTAYGLPAHGKAVPLRLGDQLVVVQHVPDAAAFRARAFAVRGDRLVPVGEVWLDGETGTPVNGRWTAAPYGDAVGVFAGGRGVPAAVVAAVKANADPDEAGPTGPTLVAVDLRGRTTVEPWVMPVVQEDPLGEAADLLILLGVGVTSTILLFSFWRRDPMADPLRLPDDLTLADTFRRGFAGLIDLSLGIYLTTVIYSLSLEEVYARWPGRGAGATFEMLTPGFTAIGLVVAHTTALELLTGRSLGKFVAGLRVATLDGRRARPWQVLVRGLLKTFDLIAYFLLILPVISPYRQRLGDMVGRTVVVTRVRRDPDDDSHRERDDRGGDDS